MIFHILQLFWQYCKKKKKSEKKRKDHDQHLNLFVVVVVVGRMNVRDKYALYILHLPDSAHVMPALPECIVSLEVSTVS